jgi:hypothetical protein
MNVERAALAAAVIAGLGLGLTVGLREHRQDHREATRDSVEFSLPDGYESAELSLARLAGTLRIADAVAFAPTRGHPGQTAIVGVTPPGTLQLIKKPAVAGLAIAEAPQLVLIGSAVAVRVPGETVAEDGKRWQVILYVVAGAKRDVTLACASQQTDRVDDSCERLATTLRIPGSFGAVPETNTLREYRAELEARVRGYERGVAGLRENLAHARTPQLQASEAGGLAAISTRTARQLASLPPDPLAAGPQRALAAALNALAGTYARLRRAAADSDRARYARARAAIGRGVRVVRARERAAWRVANLGP